MKRKICIYVKDILEYMERSEKHIKDISYEEFLDDIKTLDAIIRCIEVIGEAELKTFLMISGINTLLFHGATCQE